MTSVVPRYWLTISCSPPCPLTRLSVMPVIPARNSAALTSGRRSGRTIVVISFISSSSSPSLAGVEHELRDVAHQRVRVFIFLDPARRHDQHVPSPRRRLHDGGIMIHQLPNPAGLVIHGCARRQPGGNAFLELLAPENRQHLLARRDG